MKTCDLIDVLKSSWRKLWNIKPLYWLRSHTFTRYHIVDCRSPDYRWGYIDPCDKMFHACFSVLVDFVENEDPEIGLRTYDDYFPPDSYTPSNEEIESLEKQLAREREIRELYIWWTKTRFEEREMCNDAVKDIERFDCAFDGAFDGENGERWRSYVIEHDRLDDKRVEMLNRLIAVRQHLWT